MKLKTSNEGEVTVVKIEGNLDTQTSPEAQDELNRLMDEGSQKLLLDFADLAYISSSGLRVLLAVAKRLAPEEGEMRICNLNDVVNEVFEISGFSTILKVFPSDSEALEGIRSSHSSTMRRLRSKSRFAARRSDRKCRT
jgi:anti-anti-sigma factor